MRKVTTQSVVKFFKGLVCHFGVPNRVITDNGTQFTSRTFMQYIQDLGSKVGFASVAHHGAMVKLRGQTLKYCED